MVAPTDVGENGQAPARRRTSSRDEAPRGSVAPTPRQCWTLPLIPGLPKGCPMVNRRSLLSRTFFSLSLVVASWSGPAFAQSGSAGQPTTAYDDDDSVPSGRANIPTPALHA